MFNEQGRQEEFETFILGIEGSVGFFDPAIKLKSGRPGHYYFDLRNTYNSREVQQRLAGYIYDFSLEKGMKPSFFLGVPQGASSTGTAATYKIDYYKDVPVPILRTEPKGHGDPRDRASVGHFERGTPVVIVEDVTTTGGSSIKYVLNAQNAGLDVLGFIAILNRMEKRDGGLYVSEFFDRVLHVPFYDMANAERLLPKMYEELKPPEHVVANVEKYFRDYCGRELKLSKASIPKIDETEKITAVAKDRNVESQRSFEREFMFSVPFNGYVNGCSLQPISTVAREYQKLVATGNPDDPCLYVFLRRPLPEGINLPSHYEGLPVISRVIGDIDDEEPPIEE